MLTLEIISCCGFSGYRFSISKLLIPKDGALI